MTILVLCLLLVREGIIFKLLLEFSGMFCILEIDFYRNYDNI